MFGLSPQPGPVVLKPDFHVSGECRRGSENQRTSNSVSQFDPKMLDLKPALLHKSLKHKPSGSNAGIPSAAMHVFEPGAVVARLCKGFGAGLGIRL